MSQLIAAATTHPSARGVHSGKIISGFTRYSLGGGYVHDKSQTANTKTGISGLNYGKWLPSLFGVFESVNSQNRVNYVREKRGPPSCVAREVAMWNLLLSNHIFYCT